ncbi:hypothetical protein Sya03_14510 [Spirilliplanes yamanashiensis]|uniref:Chitin-binding type-3 domain-containing protein n=1 Tax=Spirilliplanes yamanashiensis TaxID=42233 RepID=A0A8J4DI79_9ACTN|nr:hypothetical protein [Spirilliplanes yamanashiensis]GIJ02099.1 hypothetical protein Sya03_14510 [Spirilliplanes yamanashiensis]
MSSRSLRRWTAVAAALLLGAGAVVLARPGEAAVTLATVAYPAASADVTNPERGPARYYLCGQKDQRLSVDLLTTRRTDEGTTLAWCMVYLNEYRASPLTGTWLAGLEADFAALRNSGVKTVIRFAYTDKEAGDDATKDRVLGHIGQLGPVLRANADVIAAVQAGFIGAWGEWYYTQNFGNEGQVSDTDLAARKAVLEALLAALPADRMVQLRVPKDKRTFYGTAPLPASRAYDGSNQARVGIHNDCFLASDTDMGTYFSDAERTWHEAESVFTVMGGETCAESPRSTCPTARAELAQFHWSYLNLDYRKEVLDTWGACLPEIRQRLGYRFALTEGTFPESAAPGGTLPVRLGVRNEGYAAPYNPRAAQLVLRRTSDGQVVRLPLAADPRRWAPGATTTVAETLRLPANLPAGQYQLGLALPDPAPSLSGRPEYAVRVANAGLWREDDGGWNDLLHTVTIAGTAAPTTAAPTTAAPTTAAPTTAAPTTAAPGVAAWTPFTAYRVGDRVSHGGVTYRALQAHTSLPGWEPSIVPALWTPAG